MLWLSVGGSVAVGVIVVVLHLRCVVYVFNERLFVGFPGERVDAELKPMRYCCTACVIIVIVVVGFVVVVVVAVT